MRRWSAAALAFALAAAAAYAMQLGPSCKSSKDCGRAQECVAHEDRDHERLPGRMPLQGASGRCHALVTREKVRAHQQQNN